MRKTVLALGLDPAFADFTRFPDLTPDLIRAFIDSQLERLRNLGYNVDSCLVDLGDTAEAVTTEHLNSRHFDCVVIGAGLRDPTYLLLFREALELNPCTSAACKIVLQHKPGGHCRSSAAVDMTDVRAFAVGAPPTAKWTAQQLREAFPWDSAPQ